MASFPHCFSHILQPMQPFEHTAFVFLPLSFEEHFTAVFISYGFMEIIPFGQAFTHFAQLMHISGQISAIPSVIFTAPSVHTETQSPSPIQPYMQLPSPP